MSSWPTYPFHRREVEIIHYIESMGRASITEIIREFSLKFAPMTVRKYVNQLVEGNVLEKESLQLGRYSQFFSIKPPKTLIAK